VLVAKLTMKPILMDFVVMALTVVKETLEWRTTTTRAVRHGQVRYLESDHKLLWLAVRYTIETGSGSSIRASAPASSSTLKSITSPTAKIRITVIRTRLGT
jgi:hypothetical protein